MGIEPCVTPTLRRAALPLSYFDKAKDVSNLVGQPRIGSFRLKGPLGAVNRIRTCDPVLGRNVLYQLSYYRILFKQTRQYHHGYYPIHNYTLHIETCQSFVLIGRVHRLG